jgi:hypothetical protein
VRGCGVRKDKKDIRDRWKGRGRVSEIYNDFKLPYSGAKVAENFALGDHTFIWIVRTMVTGVKVQ